MKKEKKSQTFPSAEEDARSVLSISLFAIGKMHFLIRTKALVVFPGGYDILDELLRH